MGVRSEPLARIGALDGVRAGSILLVLAGHLLPLGPASLEGNSVAATSGMALFFVLSGYFVARMLYAGIDFTSFMIRRLLRIVPLAYLFSVVVFFAFDSNPVMLRNALLFVSNYTDGPYVWENGHLWSLCVEIQFYLGMAALFVLLGKRAKWAVLALAPVFTLMRVVSGDGWSTMTHLRGDELLAGCLLYLSAAGAYGDLSRFWRLMGRLWPLTLLVFLAAAHPLVPVLPLLRAWPAALLVGGLLYCRQDWLRRLLESAPLAYIAKISYALYIVHLACATGWLADDNKLVLYGIKRPISFALMFALAHLSTHYYEAFWNRLAHRLTERRPRPKAAQVQPA